MWCQTKQIKQQLKHRAHTERKHMSATYDPTRQQHKTTHLQKRLAQHMQMRTRIPSKNQIGSASMVRNNKEIKPITKPPINLKSFQQN